MSKRIMYLRGEGYRPIGCVAIALQGDRSSVEYQLSVLNPVDQFNRKMARHLALGRLVEMPISIPVPENANMHTISEAVMNDLANSKTAPSRAVKAARNWLKQEVEISF